MGNQQITFTDGDVTCEGRVVCPEGVTDAPGIVICHPHPLYGGDMQNAVVRGLAEAFAAAGFVVLRFNFRGVGKSTGHYSEGIGEQEDAKTALQWLAAHPVVDSNRLFLAGYSFGARVALTAASTAPCVGGLIVVAPPILRGDWLRLDSCRGPKIFLCGDRDPYAPPEILEQLVHNLPEPKRLLIFPGTDHFFVGQERVLGQCAVKLLEELSSPTSR